MKVLTIIVFILAIASVATGGDMDTITNTQLAVTIARKGAELQSIRHIPTDTEYLWQGNPEFWSNRAPNMFPVNVRFKDNRYTYKGAEFEMPRMGLAKEAQFKLLEDTGNKNSIIHVLQSSEETLRYFPFPFRLEVISVLQGLTLVQRYRVTNTGTATMFFALGGHPGFRTPFIHGRNRSDYQYRFSKVMTVDRNVISNSLVTNNYIPFLQNEDRLTLNDPRIPTGGMFLENHDSRQISVAMKGCDPYITVSLEDFPNTNLWSPPGMPYLCIEPMVSHHDFETTEEDIEKKSFLISLPAGESRTYQYSITIHPEEGARALN